MQAHLTVDGTGLPTLRPVPSFLKLRCGNSKMSVNTAPEDAFCATCCVLAVFCLASPPDWNIAPPAIGLAEGATVVPQQAALQTTKFCSLLHVVAEARRQSHEVQRLGSCTLQSKVRNTAPCLGLPSLVPKLAKGLKLLIAGRIMAPPENI